MLGKLFVSPLLLFLAINLFVLFARRFGGVEYPGISLGAWIYYLLFIVTFVCSYCTTHFIWFVKVARHARQKNLQHINGKANKMLLYANGGAFLWFLIASVDLFGNTKFMEIGVTQARYENMENGISGSFFGIIENMLVGFPVVCMAIIVAKYSSLGRNLRWIGVFLFFTSVAYGFFGGGRNSAFLSILFVGFSWLISTRVSQSPALKFSKKHAVLAIVFLSVVAYIFIDIIVDRENMRNRDPKASIENLIDGFASGGRIAEISDPALSAQVYAMFLVYLTHPINELDILMSSDVGPFWGGYGGYQPILLLNVLGLALPDINSITAMLPKPGVYIGLTGTAYVDFGFAGIIIALILGVMSSIVKTSHSRNPERSCGLWYTYILLLLSVSPIYFVASVSNGFSILCALIVVTLVSKFRFRT